MANSPGTPASLTGVPEIDFLGGGGGMGVLMRGFDWSNTSFGPVQTWSQGLRSAASICLGSGFPIAIYWGHDLSLLYNDAWSPILGDKHPWALGRPARVVWPEIWNTIGPLFDQVLATGKATRSMDQLLPMRRRGYTEECYFDYTFSPILSDSGKVEGIFNAVLETTERVISERRLRTLGELAASANEGRDAVEACRRAAAVLQRNTTDLPFALIYLLDEAAAAATLAGYAGIAPDHPAAPGIIDLAGSDPPWPLAAAMDQAGALIDEAAGSRFSASLPSGPWPEPVQAAAILRLAAPGRSRPTGFLVAGVNPRRSFDAPQEQFFSLVAGHVATAVANARAYDEAQRRAAALAAIDRAKTAFFSNVSHEFRTPLTLMLGPLEDELATGPAGDTRERLLLVHRNALRLQKLVNALLDFSRIEAGRMQAAYEPTDLSTLTRDLASSFRSAIAKAGLSFVIECPPLPEPVYVDTEMWEKIVLNLLSNAFKFTWAGTIAVRLHPAGDSVELSVKDTGTGIPEHELARVFERFHRIEGTAGRTAEGTGIGLALVQELVKLHGGSVWAESEPERGSTFRVRIPFGAAHLPGDRINARRTLASTALRSEAYVEEALRWLPGHGESGAASTLFLDEIITPQPEPGNADRRRLLLVDDNADMREYLERLLSPRYDVMAVASGQDALRTALAARPDLILSDVMMPGLDGFGLLQRLRADPRTRTVPVILLSARAGEESRVEGLDAGADDYLVKPFSARELLARVSARIEIARVHRESKAALEESEARLAALLEELPVGAGLTDAEGRWILQNRLLREVVGSAIPSRDAEEGWRWRAWWPDGRELEPLDYPGARALRGETVTGVDFLHTSVSGKETWMRVSAAPFRGTKGEIRGVACVIQDVDAQKRSDEGLRESEERFRSIFNQTVAGIAETDLEGRFVQVNGQFCHITGRSAEELYGLRMQDITHPDDLERNVPLFLRAITEGAPFVIEKRYVRPDGSCVWVSNSVSLIRGAAGQPKQIVAVSLDITERKRFEEALRESEERFRHMADHAPVMVWLTDADGTATYLNRRWYEFTGQTPDAPLGFGWLEAVHPDDRKTAEDAFLRANADHQPFRIEYRLLRKDGEWRWSIDAAAPRFAADGTFLGHVGSVIDITDRKNMEDALRRANGDLEQFAYSASHDLQEPLRMVSIYSQLLQKNYKGRLDARADEFIGYCTQGSQRMQALLHDLLAYARAATEPEPPTVETDLNGVLRDALDNLRTSIGESEAVVTCDSLPTLHVEPVRIQMVFQNLIGNAVKYRRRDEPPRVHVSARRAASGWVFSVSDNGIGIAPQYLDQVFGLFKRLHHDKSTGTGLGLAICQRTVERFGGRIWVESELGRGSTFYFSLPAA